MLLELISVSMEGKWFSSPGVPAQIVSADMHLWLRRNLDSCRRRSFLSKCLEKANQTLTGTHAREKLCRCYILRCRCSLRYWDHGINGLIVIHAKAGEVLELISNIGAILLQPTPREFVADTVNMLVYRTGILSPWPGRRVQSR